MSPRVAFADDLLKVFHGDCLEVLQALPDESVHCCVTSPPYWGLRDYGVPPTTWPDGWVGCHGLEPTPDLYIAHEVLIFQEVRRVLRSDGTCWVNIASSYSSTIIESHDYIIKRDLDREFRKKIAQAMSSVWSSHESPESALSSLLHAREPKAAELHDKAVPCLRKGIHEAQMPKGKVLQSVVRSLGEPNTTEEPSIATVQDVREADTSVSIGDSKECVEKGVLQSGVLVCLQSKGQSLPLGGWSTRQNEPGGCEMAACRPESRPSALSDLSHQQAIRSSPHSSVLNPQGGSVGCEERDNALPRLPCKVPPQGDGAFRNTGVHGNHPGRGLEDLVFHKSLIPDGFLVLCEPVSVIKPKDDALIPQRLSLALQADGWFLRQDIIWEKPNPMPESVTDRCTKSHEYIFLLSKSPTYFYDNEAIKEKAIADHPAGNKRHKGATAYAGGATEHRTKQGLVAYAQRTNSPPNGSRNKRSVWTVTTKPFKGAHFATFPPKLIEPCILAGTSPRCCADCGAPWERVVERRLVPTAKAAKTSVVDGRDDSADSNDQGSNRQKDGHMPGMARADITLGWQPTCECHGKLTRQKVVLPARISKEEAAMWGADSTGEYHGESTKGHPDEIQNASDVKRRIIENATNDREVTRWVYSSDLPMEQHPVKPAVVLDPFGGSGTTGEVANKHGRGAILIELNPSYVPMILNRTKEKGLALA